MGAICFFNSAKAWGGGEKWHLETSQYMHEKGHDVIVIAHKESVLYKRLKGTGIKLVGIMVSNLSFTNPIKIKTTQNILKEYKVDTILINLSRDLKLAGIAAKKAKISKIIYRRGSAIPIKNTFLNRFYFKNVVTHVLANSEATKKTVLECNNTLFPTDKIKVIYNGINTQDFIDKTYTPLYKKENIDEITLVNLGRLEKQKNQVFLIDLAKELKKRKINFKIVIGGDGRLKEELMQKVALANLSDCIYFTGFVKNPKDLINSGDIFVLPSLWEGFGYVLAEAALCKKPVLAFNISSNPEIVLKDKTGFLTPCNEVIAMAGKVVFFTNNPSEITKMGEAAYERASRIFDNKNTFRQVEDYLINE